VIVILLSSDDSAPVPASLMVYVIRWDEKAGLRRDAVRSQVIDVREAQINKETGNEKG